MSEGAAGQKEWKGNDMFTAVLDKTRSAKLNRHLEGLTIEDLQRLEHEDIIKVAAKTDRLLMIALLKAPEFAFVFYPDSQHHIPAPDMKVKMTDGPVDVCLRGCFSSEHRTALDMELAAMVPADEAVPPFTKDTVVSAIAKLSGMEFNSIAGRANKLDLRSCGLRDEDAEEVFGVVEMYPNLRILDLSYNRIQGWKVHVGRSASTTNLTPGTELHADNSSDEGEYAVPYDVMREGVAATTKEYECGWEHLLKPKTEGGKEICVILTNNPMASVDQARGFFKGASLEVFTKLICIPFAWLPAPH